MVQTCDQIKWPLQKDRTSHSTRENKKRKAKEKMGRQHQRVDRSRLQQQSREQPKAVRDGRRLSPMSAVVPLRP